MARCRHFYHGAQCCLEAGHSGIHLFKCASPKCPGRQYPASKFCHPVNCGYEQPKQSDAEQLELGITLKNEGQDRVVANNREWVTVVRAIARAICDKRGSVSTDDLREWTDKNQYYPEHPNAWGGIFRGKAWRAVGFKQSKHPSNHARRIIVWEIRDEKTKSLQASNDRS